MKQSQRKTKKENRTETIQARVSPIEHEKIKKRAEVVGYGIELPSYLRYQASCPNTEPSEGKLRQQIATLLCTHAQLVEATDDPALRLQYSNWEEKAWQSIKSSIRQATTATEMQQNEC